MSSVAAMLANVVNLQDKKIKTTPLKKVDQIKVTPGVKNYCVMPWRAVTDERINKSAAIIVLMAICGHTNRVGETYVSQQTLADILKVTRQAIQKQMSILVKYGYLEVIQRGGKHFSSRHRVVFSTTVSFEEAKANMPARLRDDNSEPPPAPKETAIKHLEGIKNILKGKTSKQPQELHEDGISKQPQKLTQDDCQSNQKGFLRQPNGGVSATSTGCTKVVEGNIRYTSLEKWLNEE